ncbi:MAG: class I SAM-dependent methyltransferase, partial [Planctomycetota bacterium]
MDRDLYSFVRHAALELISPLPMSAYEVLLRDLFLQEPADLLDVGCGKGTLLLAFARRGWRSHGVERSPLMAEAARQAALDQHLQGRFRITQADAAQAVEALPSASIDCALCIGSSHALGGLDRTLVEFSRLVRPGGNVVIGELYWRCPPQQEFLDALGMNAADLGDLSATLAKGPPFGLELLASQTATPQEFASYEAAQRHAGAAWCTANPNHPAAPAIAARSESWW